jgi:6-pyruvoyltetrahydropterin/6-carboxytetrahydropterin synthase
MEARIAKEFRWEMGHRLPYHTGGCQNIHGHSYSMRVEVIGDIDPTSGMVMDYFDLKSIVQPIVDQLDHSFLCDHRDEAMQSFFRENPMKVNIVPFYSTAENIAAWILSQLIPGIQRCTPVHTVRVRLRETENTYAELEHRYQR